jgi:alanine racemase
MKDIAGGRLTIDLGALAENWRFIGRLASEAETGAVIKGDGYGIGIEEAARALARAGCKTFFVALPAEGLRVRRVSDDAAIYVLDGLFPGAARIYAEADLRPVLGSWAEVEEWAAFRRGGGDTASAIHVDTGMNRLGLTLREALALARQRDLLDAIAPSLLISHLACADMPEHPLNTRQLALFREIQAEFPGVRASLANSAGVFLGPDYHFDLVRPGVSLYGAGLPPGSADTLRPVVTATARVIAVREADEGETVGYGATQRLSKPSRIAILSAGYADGYLRAASSSDARPGGHVHIRNGAAPIVGRVSMDLIAIDVTDLPGVRRGDWAELFGPNVPIDDVAEIAGTIGYELLTGLGRRCERRYVGGAD